MKFLSTSRAIEQSYNEWVPFVVVLFMYTKTHIRTLVFLPLTKTMTIYVCQQPFFPLLRRGDDEMVPTSLNTNCDYSNMLLLMKKDNTKIKFKKQKNKSLFVFMAKKDETKYYRLFFFLFFLRRIPVLVKLWLCSWVEEGYRN